MELSIFRPLQRFWLSRSTRQRGTAIVAIPATCLFASLVTITWMRDQTLQARRQLENSQEIIQQLDRLLHTIITAETSVRGYGLTRRPEFLEPYRQAKTILPNLENQLNRLLKETHQASQFSTIEKTIQYRMSVLENGLRQINLLSPTATPSAALINEMMQGKVAMERLRQQLANFSATEETYQVALEVEIANWVNLTNLAQLIVLLVGLLGAGASLCLFTQLEQELSLRERSLQESKSRIQAVVDNAADGIATLDEAGKIESFNPVAEKLFGISASEAMGSNLRRLIAQASISDTTTNPFKNFIQDRNCKLTPCQEETVGIRSDGTTFPIDIAVSEMRLPDRRRFIAILRDITERRQAEETRQSQARLLDLANDSIVVLTLEGEITYWNQGSRRLYGWKQAEATGQNIHNLLQTEFPQSLEEISAKFLRDGYWEGELVRRRKDGTQVIVASRWSLQRNETGQSQAILEINNDISERKQAEVALAESEQRFRATFEQAAVGMAQTDLQGKLSIINQKLCDLLGYRREELLGKQFQTISYAEDLSIELSYLNQLLAGEIENYSMEKRFICQDGSLLWTNLTVYLLRPPNGRQSLMGVVEDIQERKQTEEALKKRAQELALATKKLSQTTSVLRKRNQELDQFAYVVSHDLKAPLRAIANLSSWIEEDLEEFLTEDTRHQMNLLRGRVHRMEALIDGLLQYSRVGRLQLTPETVNVEELLVEIIDSLAPPASFTVEVAPGMPVLTTEKLLLQQVFSNLISNAIKHNKSADGRVTIAVQDLEDFYEFSVADNGPGIAAQYHEKVFAIFQTLEARDKVENTGIGLSLVKKIVENQGGTILLDSAEGEGATFRFTWPKHPLTKSEG